MNAGSVERLIFDVASALLIPVIVAALGALVLVIVESGRTANEVLRRRARSFPRLESTAGTALSALQADDRPRSVSALTSVAWSRSMMDAMVALVDRYGRSDWEGASAKILADFDYGSVRRLNRTRLLVRAGPALGLMGTLIPLSPALAALASGDVTKLTKDLRIAFGITVLGLFIGAVAFGVSLIRDRMYSQDFSDLEYVAARLSATGDPEISPTLPAPTAPGPDDAIGGPVTAEPRTAP